MHALVQLHVYIQSYIIYNLQHVQQLEYVCLPTLCKHSFIAAFVMNFKNKHYQALER